MLIRNFGPAIGLPFATREDLFAKPLLLLADCRAKSISETKALATVEGLSNATLFANRDCFGKAKCKCGNVVCKWQLNCGVAAEKCDAM